MVGFLWTISLLGPVALITGANAQVTAPSCDASLDYTWSFNSLDQDPCIVTTYLGQVCNSAYFIPAIPNPTYFYTGPLAGDSTLCQCNTVFYMLLTACGACQGESEWPAWSTYNTNCTALYLSQFPENIPSGTKVPQWAYLDITTDGTFNPTAAEAVGDSPESTGNSIPTATAPTPSSISTSVSTTTKKHHSELAPIVGGAVGGVVFLCLCALAVICCKRRKSGARGRKAPSAQVDLSGIDELPQSYPVVPAHSQTDSNYMEKSYHGSLPSVAHKLYDPSDPTTFPPSMLSTSPSSPISMGSSAGLFSQGTGETSNTGYHPSAQTGYGMQGRLAEI